MIDPGFIVIRTIQNQGEEGNDTILAKMQPTDHMSTELYGRLNNE